MEKSILTSKTFWGAVITLIAPALETVGIDLGDQETAIQAIMGLVGAIVVIYGRIKAVKPIKGA